MWPAVQMRGPPTTVLRIRIATHRDRTSQRHVAAAALTAHCEVVDFRAAVVELYGLEPEQFIADRDQLAKAARDDGDERTSAAIKALRKPTVAAWLANQLVRVDPEGIHALTELGEQLLEAFLSADSARRRELTRQRHPLVRGLVQTARERVAETGR